MSMAKKIFFSIFILSLELWTASGVFAQPTPDAEQQDAGYELQQLKKEYDSLLRDRENLAIQLKNAQQEVSGTTSCEELRQEYEKTVRDRDNIEIQMKSLLKYKNEMRVVEDEIKRLKDNAREFDLQKESLSQTIADLKNHIEALQKDKAELGNQIEALNKRIEAEEVRYKMSDALSEDLRRLEIQNQRLEEQARQLNEQLKKADSEKIAVKAESEIYRRQIEVLKKQYTESLKTNKQLDEKLTAVPKKFAEIARENQVLLRETALMHYNLGVFYIEEGQHKRAVAELEKAIELNPDDAYAYFNLGYIYAEYLVNRPQAIDYFQQYLKLASREDKEVDWVKKYILTWQAWEGEKPLK